MEIGSGKRYPEWSLELLELRDRKQAAMTAAADGLYLGGVYYPGEFGIPKNPIFDLLPADASRFVHESHEHSDIEAGAIY
jgi:tRNA pseudouridine38-40 synthase